MNLFIFGAGFSKAVIEAAPLNSELLPRLMEQPHCIASKELFRRFEEQDIEIALTQLDIESLKSRSLSRGVGVDRESDSLRDGVEREIASFIGQFTMSKGLMEETPWLRAFVDGVVAVGDVAISLNYDCLLEGALDLADKWSPLRGYGSVFRNPVVEEEGFSESPVRVLKIHGSVSFVAAPLWGAPGSKFISFEVNEGFFENSGKNRRFEVGAGQGRPYLIAPSFVKIPSAEIVYVMFEALSAARAATNLIVVGSFLRDEDQFLTLIWTEFLRNGSYPEGKMIIVDPRAREIYERLSRFWGVDMSTRIVQIEAGVQESVNEILARTHRA